MIDSDQTIPDKVTEEPVKASLSAGVIVAIVLGVMLCCLPVLVYFVLKCIAKYKPNSKIGIKFNAWKEQRALNAQ